MNAPRPIKHAVRGMGRNALDLPVAALAGLAVVFVVVAVPADFLSAVVNGTGLPALIPAAAPPLGLTARIGAGIAGALGTFGLVYLLLRLLDRTGLEKIPAPRPAASADEDAPKLRRRDVHPDAPGRRPISAARDLGEPAPPRAPRVPPPPLWLAEAEPLELEVEVAVEPAPAPVPEPAPEPQPELVIEPEPRPEPVPAPASSLAELMERLERGLARREPRPAPAAAPQVFPEARDDRLQSAIDSLQRLASRQS